MKKSLAVPPRAGKTMVEKRIPKILPTLRVEGALEATKVYFAAGKFDDHTVLMIKGHPGHSIIQFQMTYDVAGMSSIYLYINTI